MNTLDFSSDNFTNEPADAGMPLGIESIDLDDDVHFDPTIGDFPPGIVDDPVINPTVIATDDSLEYTFPGGGVGASNPYASGFDEEHPVPTYEELRNAGFSDFEANKIVYGTYSSYSEKELFHCLYESDDPKAAYDAMIREKAEAIKRRNDELMSDL